MEGYVHVGAYRIQNKELDPQELELRELSCLLRVLEIELRSLATAVCACNCQAITPAQL